MKFTIIAIFCGVCGEKVVISQGGQARMVNCYGGAYSTLIDSSFTMMSMSCEIDDDGTIWIKEVRPLALDDQEGMK